MGQRAQDMAGGWRGKENSGIHCFGGRGGTGHVVGKHRTCTLAPVHWKEKARAPATQTGCARLASGNG